MKFFVSEMRPLMNVDKNRLLISLQLIPFLAVQEVYDFSVQKSGNELNDIKCLGNLRDFKTAIRKSNWF